MGRFFATILGTNQAGGVIKSCLLVLNLIEISKRAGKKNCEKTFTGKQFITT